VPATVWANTQVRPYEPPVKPRSAGQAGG
jgi:hypothetical protein